MHQVSIESEILDNSIFLESQVRSNGGVDNGSQNPILQQQSIRIDVDSTTTTSTFELSKTDFSDPEDSHGSTWFFFNLFGLIWDESVFDSTQQLLPQMFKLHNIGLFGHYAAIGFIGGIVGLCSNFCFYFYQGSDNVCANATSIIFIPWGFKIFFAMLTDSFRPFQTRRKFYMIAGWTGALMITLLLAFIGDHCTVETWLSLSVIVQAFCMLADVPADGYSVELGQLESESERGMILSTGQRIRFSFTMIAGLVQALFLNGTRTNHSGCSINFLNCWGWGLTVGQFYGLSFCILLVLVSPVLLFRELPCKHIPQHTFNEHRLELWETMKNPTTMFLLIFVFGNGCFSSMSPITTIYVQYTLIGFTNFEAGIQTIVAYLALVSGIRIFQGYFIHSNWRTTLYLSIGLSSVLGLLWLLVYYDVGGLLDPWFTIFITLDQTFAQGVSQVLFSMAVIELAKRGQEAITYELIISVSNSALSISTIVATQLLTPMKSVICTQSNVDDIYLTSGQTDCTPDEVNTYSIQTYQDSQGPNRFRNYSLMILGINLVALLFFTNFLPRQKFECAEWKAKGESGKYFLSPNIVGCISITISVVVIGYQVASAIALLNPSTSCLPEFGGGGC